jgi:hypothetical protein
MAEEICPACGKVHPVNEKGELLVLTSTRFGKQGIETTLVCPGPAPPRITENAK